VFLYTLNTSEYLETYKSIFQCNLTLNKFAHVPPKKLLGRGFSTRYTFFCSICTIISELKRILIFTHLSEPGLISSGFQWTGSTPDGFQQAFRLADTHAHKHTQIPIYIYIYIYIYMICW